MWSQLIRPKCQQQKGFEELEEVRRLRPSAAKAYRGGGAEADDRRWLLGRHRRGGDPSTIASRTTSARSRPIDDRLSDDIGAEAVDRQSFSDDIGTETETVHRRTLLGRHPGVILTAREGNNKANPLMSHDVQSLCALGSGSLIVRAPNTTVAFQ